jgi:Flp pilus assembly protein TadB
MRVDLGRDGVERETHRAGDVAVSGALAVLATALLVLPGSSGARIRLLEFVPAPRRRVFPPPSKPVGSALVSGALTAALGGYPGGVVMAAPAGVLAWWLTRFLLRRRQNQGGGGEFLRTAASLDLLAAALRSGLPVSIAVRAVAGGAPTRAAEALRATADLLDLGADPVEAWAPVRDCDVVAELARAARRTARSGTALAEAAADLAARLRSELSDQAEAKAQRAGVLITLPLGLCFLPAFVCLGVAPVVAGLASRLTVAA